MVKYPFPYVNTTKNSYAVESYKFSHCTKLIMVNFD